MKTKMPQRKQSESGTTLIELLIAGFVLVFGMLSIVALLETAVGNNGRSKIDSSATMLTQAVTDQISAKMAGGGPGSITDCNGTGTVHVIDDGEDLGLGANVLTGTGDIDFTQSQAGIPANYYMNFVQCDGNGNAQLTYDVRWHVQPLSGTTYLVTVGAKPAASSLPVRFSFSIPVNMRAYVGSNP